MALLTRDDKPVDQHRSNRPCQQCAKTVQRQRDPQMQQRHAEIHRIAAEPVEALRDEGGIGLPRFGVVARLAKLQQCRRDQARAHQRNADPHAAQHTRHRGIETQQIVRQAAQEAAEYERALNARLEGEQLQALKDAGMTVVENADLSAFSAAVQPVYEKYGEKFGDYLPRIQEALK